MEETDEILFDRRYRLSRWAPGAATGRGWPSGSRSCAQPAKAEDLAELGIAINHGDVTDKESMRAPMAGADGVFHVAAWYKVGVKHKHEAEATNVQGTRNVLELTRELGYSPRSLEEGLTQILEHEMRLLGMKK